MRCMWVTPQKWVRRRIEWQTPDPHLLSHLTCPRIPAVPSSRRAQTTGWQGGFKWATQTCKHTYKRLPYRTPQSTHKQIMRTQEIETCPRRKKGYKREEEKIVITPHHSFSGWGWVILAPFQLFVLSFLPTSSFSSVTLPLCLMARHFQENLEQSNIPKNYVNTG